MLQKGVVVLNPVENKGRSGQLRLKRVLNLVFRAPHSSGPMSVGRRIRPMLRVLSSREVTAEDGLVLGFILAGMGSIAEGANEKSVRFCDSSEKETELQNRGCEAHINGASMALLTAIT